ncbi:MAG: hypothetical protein ACOYUZ_01590 [Patescibacteria group bacterium]
MIKEAQNKKISSVPHSKSEAKRLEVQNETLQEFYFSATEERGPVTIKATSLEEARKKYNQL